MFHRSYQAAWVGTHANDKSQGWINTDGVPVTIHLPIYSPNFEPEDLCTAFTPYGTWTATKCDDEYNKYPAVCKRPESK